MAMNDVDNFINQVIHLYFELCRRAEAGLAQGPYSGAKRSILLLLRERGSLHAHDLYKEFDDPNAPSYAVGIITEMVNAGWLSLSGLGEDPRMRLTEKGAAVCQQIQEAETAFAQTLLPHMALADLRIASNIMKRIREASRSERLGSQRGGGVEAANKVA